MKGITTRITTGGLCVGRVHYESDPAKCPGEPLYEDLLAGFPLHERDPRWLKEMEIQYEALGGQKLFPLWDRWQQNGRIVVPAFDAIGYRIYGSYDHGWRHPACYLVHGVDFDGRITTLWEFHASEVPVSQISRIIKGQDVKLGDGRSFQGNPYAGKEMFKIADPQIWAQDQQNSDNPNKATFDIFLSCGVVFQQGIHGADLTVAEWLMGYFWLDPMNPMYRITDNCRQLIREIGMQRHKQFSAQVARSRAQPEALVDKDNDGWDSLKMFLVRFPPPLKHPKPTEPPNTFNWWRKVSKDTSEHRRTYRIEVS